MFEKEIKETVDRYISKGIDEGDFDLSYYILDALRKGLK